MPNITGTDVTIAGVYDPIELWQSFKAAILQPQKITK